ncbi:MAG: hypothetical protein F6J93_38320 [Oscillatoria sp. SIO1A7]|nr:hypothetical protein [Oscillatoria sp. SIO1A7]
MWEMSEVWEGLLKVLPSVPPLLTFPSFPQRKPTRCRDRVRRQRDLGVGYLPPRQATGASQWTI